MSCADVCIDMGYDADDNEFFHCADRRARKEHLCCECRRPIRPGEAYECASGKSDGRVWTSKSCAQCADIRKALVCGSWEYGALWEHIHEGVFPVWLERGPWDCLALVESEAARRELSSSFEQWKEDRA